MSGHIDSRYLNRRKEMKKKGKRGKAGEENMSAVELKLKAQHATTSGKFGEVADAPLQVSAGLEGMQVCACMACRMG